MSTWEERKLLVSLVFYILVSFVYIGAYIFLIYKTIVNMGLIYGIILLFLPPSNNALTASFERLLDKLKSMD